LQAVRDLSRETAEAIVAARRARPFSGLADFLERVRPADDEISSLIDAGAVDCLAPGANRSVLHWQAAACSGLRSAVPGRLFAPLSGSAGNTGRSAFSVAVIRSVWSTGRRHGGWSKSAPWRGVSAGPLRLPAGC
jgi:hypothetical protein